jgi:hypothetical protein
MSLPNFTAEAACYPSGGRYTSPRERRHHISPSMVTAATSYSVINGETYCCDRCGTYTDGSPMFCCYACASGPGVSGFGGSLKFLSR